MDEGELNYIHFRWRIWWKMRFIFIWCNFIFLTYWWISLGLLRYYQPNEDLDQKFCRDNSNVSKYGKLFSIFPIGRYPTESEIRQNSPQVWFRVFWTLKYLNGCPTVDLQNVFWSIEVIILKKNWISLVVLQETCYQDCLLWIQRCEMHLILKQTFENMFSFLKWIGIKLKRDRLMHQL